MRAFVVCGFTATIIFFHIISVFFFKLFKNEPTTRDALTFLKHIILAIGGVNWQPSDEILFPWDTKLCCHAR